MDELDLSKWSSPALELLKSQIEEILRSRENSHLYKTAWADTMESVGDDLYQSGEAARLLEKQSKEK